MRLHGNQKIDLIKHVPLFARCSRGELKEIAFLADEIDLKEGKEMTREGAPGREFFVLLEGTAEVKKGNRKLNTDRKSTRLNSSHLGISYAVFCLKKKILTNTEENERKKLLAERVM